MSRFDIMAAYSESHRRYHTWRHIEECLQLLQGLFEARLISGDEWVVLDLALRWHDAVYDPLAKFGRNELRSALLAVEHSPVSDENREEIARLILLTVGHEVAPDDRVGAIMVSIDLAILGSSEERYREYVTQVREEYAAVSDAAFVAGRKQFLNKMLAEATIFPFEPLRERFEEQARKNMQWEFDRISS